MRRHATKLKDVMKSAKDLASDVFSDDLIEITSNRYAIIGGCVRLTEYNGSVIRISFRDMTVEFLGEDLEPESLINGQMALRGVIREVRYIDN